MVLICYKQVDNSVKIWWLVSFVIKLFVNNKKLPVSVLTEPPYVVKEQGYAGFLINVDIYFKGLPDNDAGKKVSFLSSCRCQARWKWCKEISSTFQLINYQLVNSQLVNY